MVLMFSGAFGRALWASSVTPLARCRLICSCLGQTISVVWFPHVAYGPELYVLAIFIGFTYSGVMSAILVCTRTMVSAGFAARAMSITGFFGWLGMGLGGYLGGVFFDLRDYELSFAFAMIVGWVT